MVRGRVLRDVGAAHGQELGHVHEARQRGGLARVSDPEQLLVPSERSVYLVNFHEKQFELIESNFPEKMHYSQYAHDD